MDQYSHVLMMPLQYTKNKIQSFHLKKTKLLCTGSEVLLMTQFKRNGTPLLTHWSYISCIEPSICLFRGRRSTTSMSLMLTVSALQTWVSCSYVRGYQWTATNILSSKEQFPYLMRDLSHQTGPRAVHIRQQATPANTTAESKNLRIPFKSSLLVWGNAMLFIVPVAMEMAVAAVVVVELRPSPEFTEELLVAWEEDVDATAVLWDVVATELLVWSYCNNNAKSRVKLIVQWITTSNL